MAAVAGFAAHLEVALPRAVVSATTPASIFLLNPAFLLLTGQPLKVDTIVECVVSAIAVGAVHLHLVLNDRNL